ncbi:MAG: flagellar biosynthetic protein FliQ [Myxococcales bacterium]|nr:flagellar biosynthetic protein FliQ [Myxococcales bacterium]
MDPTTLDVVLSGLGLAAWLALPIVGAGLLAGVIGGILQAVTGWQDAALGQVPRLLAVVLVLVVAGPRIAAAVVDFARLAWGGP